MALRLARSLGILCSPSTLSSSTPRRKKPLRLFRCSTDNQTLPYADARKLVSEVKDKLGTEHPHLPVGKHGRDDEDLILQFLEDRRFSVEDAIFKLTKAIKWRQEFGVSELTEESVRNLYETGKAYLHDFPDVQGRPVLVVVASKHFPVRQDVNENEKLCVFLVEKALRNLPTGKGEILAIIDLRGFHTENADISFLRFLGPGLLLLCCTVAAAECGAATGEESLQCPASHTPCCSGITSARGKQWCDQGSGNLCSIPLLILLQYHIPKTKFCSTNAVAYLHRDF